jgi:ParB/RepB/Spo0J family partition protein
MDEEKLNELSADIRVKGVLQPLIVRRLTEAEKQSILGQWVELQETNSRAIPAYRIVAGHRRFLASRMAGLQTVPCVVYDSGELADEAVMLSENFHRENVTPAEEGLFIAQYIEKHNPLEADLPRIFGRSLDSIYDRLSFVRGFADIVQANAERKINYAVAKELMKCTDTEHRRYLLGHAIEGGATAGVVRGWIVAWKGSQCAPRTDTGSQTVTVTPTMLPQAPAGCIFCGSTENPHSMVQIAIHEYEIKTLIGMLKQLGVREGQQ